MKEIPALYQILDKTNYRRTRIHGDVFNILCIKEGILLQQSHENIAFFTTLHVYDPAVSDVIEQRNIHIMFFNYQQRIRLFQGYWDRRDPDPFLPHPRGASGFSTQNPH